MTDRSGPGPVATGGGAGARRGGGGSGGAATRNDESESADEEWRPVREAAGIVGVKESTLRSWSRSGVVPSRVERGPHGKRRLVSVAAVRRRAAGEGPSDRAGDAGGRAAAGEGAAAPDGQDVQPTPAVEDLRAEAEEKLAQLYERLAEARRQAGRPEAVAGTVGPAAGRGAAVQPPPRDDLGRGQAPSPPPGRDGDAAPPAGMEDGDRARRAEVEAAALRQHLDELRAEAERRLAQFDQALAEADHELTEAQERARRAEAEVALLRERDELRAEIGVKLAEVGQELEAARERGDRAEAEAASLRRQVADLQATGGDDELASARQRAERAEAELASLRRVMDDLSKNTPPATGPTPGPTADTSPVADRPPPVPATPTEAPSDQREDLQRLDAFFARRDEVANAWRDHLAAMQHHKARPGREQPGPVDAGGEVDRSGGGDAPRPADPDQDPPAAGDPPPMRFWARRKRG